MNRYEMEKLLIEKVKQREVLYNMGSPHYRDQNRRQEAWQDIAWELKMTGTFLREFDVKSLSLVLSKVRLGEWNSRRRGRIL